MDNYLREYILRYFSTSYKIKSISRLQNGCSFESLKRILHRPSHLVLALQYLDSTVGTTTSYELNRLDFESLWGKGILLFSKTS